ncbi:hypothetical protein SH449x_001189 [Pirellulaceae bacterium SH449]
MNSLPSNNSNNSGSNPYAVAPEASKGRNWLAIIAVLLGIFVVSPFVLLVGAVVCLSVVAGVGSRARMEQSQTETLERPVSAQSTEVIDEFAN